VFSLASHLKDIPELLLLRSGLMFIASSADQPGDAEQAVRGFELELAHLGYVASARLRERALAASAAELQQLRDLVIGASFKATGGHRKLEPMFRRFPDDIPEDTRTLWWDRVIVHFLQAPEQPCVLCRRSGTVHVLNPCAHLVCDRCFDGSNYSGCPICNRTVDPSSPFFRPVERGPADRVAAARTFALLDLGNYVADRNMETASSELFRSLCLRTQAMSPVDVDALLALIEAYRGKVLEWVPPRLPVRENTALIFGTSLRIALQAAAGEREPAALSPVAIMRVARHHLSTATDVLRLIAALSGVSVALLPETKITRGDLPDAVKRFGKVSRSPMRVISHHRFKVAKLPRSLRRELLALLDEMPAAQLLEDLDRHHSRWVWVAELLHPGEYAKRYRNAARGFSYLRNGAEAPGAAPAVALRPWPSAVERAITRNATAEALVLLAQRPGEFVRCFDRLLRGAAQPAAVVEAFTAVLDRAATPALVSLRSHLAVRAQPLPARVFWPKAKFCVPTPPADRRPSLPADAIEQTCSCIDAELLRRFSVKPAFDTAIFDDALSTIMVPFNERTASRSAVQLPRGSAIALPDGKLMRLFLHWCEPPGGSDTDIDLSVGFFDRHWDLVGACSYYQLNSLDASGRPMARSSGDFTSAPWPKGASEFVDLDLRRALAHGYAYAVMVVNAFNGMPFRELARATAGVMLRDDGFGDVFDPTSVALAFSLDGGSGNYMPVVVDLQTSTLHWLDAYSEGLLTQNNVETAQRSIGRICPAMISYFASGTRPSMLDLGRYHAAARCRRVVMRGTTHRSFERGGDESALSFLERLRTGRADQVVAAEPEMTDPVFAMVLRGDLTLPEGSSVYALFRHRLVPTMAAADLLA
jgi:hypothetical protein